MNRIITTLFASMCLSGAAWAEDEPPKAENKAGSNDDAKLAKKTQAEKTAARRLEFMNKSAKEYEFLLGPDFKSKLVVEPAPLLRFTNPVSGLQDGGFYVWKSESGRPMVGAQLFLTSEDLWIHEFQSLAPVPFRVTREDKVVWDPRVAGVSPKPVPEAPTPASTPVQRLVQMRDIAQRFAASDEFEGRPKSDALRLLAKPLVRFGTEKSETLDGALFAHAHGTDPELMIVLEALKSGDGYVWNYSLAPMTGYALKASLDDKPVWEVSWRKGPYDPKDPFYILVHSREVTLKNLLPFSK